MKKILILFVLVMGFCTTVSEPPSEQSNKYFKDMFLKDQNEVERWLKGKWIPYDKTIENTHVIEEFLFTEDKGKRIRQIVIDNGTTNAISEYSYEIKYDLNKPNKSLLVLYTMEEGEESIPWDKFPLYTEIEQREINLYYQYIRYYASEEAIKEGPTALKRGNSLGAWKKL